jgi:hypothetical protein
MMTSVSNKKLTVRELLDLKEEKSPGLEGSVQDAQLQVGKRIV